MTMDELESPGLMLSGLAFFSMANDNTDGDWLFRAVGALAMFVGFTALCK